MYKNITYCLYSKDFSLYFCYIVRIIPNLLCNILYLLIYRYQSIIEHNIKIPYILDIFYSNTHGKKHILTPISISHSKVYDTAIKSSTRRRYATPVTYLLCINVCVITGGLLRKPTCLYFIVINFNF